VKPAYVALNSAIATSRKAPTGGVCATVAEPKIYTFSLCGFFCTATCRADKVKTSAAYRM